MILIHITHIIVSKSILHTLLQGYGKYLIRINFRADKFSRTPDFEKFRADLFSRTPKRNIFLTFALVFNDPLSKNSLHFDFIGDNSYLDNH